MKISKKEVISWFGMLLGCSILAAGFVFFINPYNIVPGGVYGLSIVLHKLFPSIQVGTFGYVFDIPLLIISAVFLGSKLGTKTFVAALTTPLIMNLMSVLSYPSKEALHSLDPTQLLGGMLNMSDQLILPVIIGSLLIGVGCGIVVNCGATTGGSDIVAMILQKYARIKFSNAVLMVDGFVVLFGLVVLGFGIGNAEPNRQAIFLSFYSMIAIYLTSRVIARVINGTKDDKILFIISENNLEDLYKYIIEVLDRSATLVKSKGIYSGDDKSFVFLVVSYKQVHKVKQKVKEVDERAFVVVTDAYDTYGEGWKDLPSMGEVIPE